MDPVTHFLTGACIGRSGFNRKTAYATLAATLAAEAADLDVVWGLRGPVEGLKHHRGITHTFIAAPVVAAVIVGFVALLHIWFEKRRLRRLAVLAPEPGAPIPLPLQEKKISWAWLYAASLIAALSHLFLDWTNNYGLRPFFPFNPRWYAGSFVFIIEPVLLLLLFAAVLVPWLLGLVGGEIGARRNPYRGRGWAIFALVGMVIVWGMRWSEHQHALSMVANTPVTTEPVTRAAAEPYPVNPFRWHVILETPSAYQTAEVNTRSGQVDSDSGRDALFKPPSDAAVEAAKRTPLGEAYLDWGMWAIVSDIGQEPAPGVPPPVLPPGQTWTTVEFSDLRFDYSWLGPSSGMNATLARRSLGASVYIVNGNEDGGEIMNRREER